MPEEPFRGRNCIYGAVYEKIKIFFYLLATLRACLFFHLIIHDFTSVVSFTITRIIYMIHEREKRFSVP